MEAAHLSDPAAEAAIISAVLTTPAAFDEVADQLTSADFSIGAASALWEAFVGCDAQGRGIDQITVLDELRRTKMLARVGGQDGLSQVLATAVKGRNLSSWVAIVKERSALRRLLSASKTISGAVLDPSVAPSDALEQAEKAIFDLGDASTSAPGSVSMPEALKLAFKAIQDAAGKELLGASTGLAELDKLTSGVRGGQLIVLAARPGIGKSALAVQIARTIAEASGEQARMYSYEMSATELTLRLLASACETNLQDLSTGRLHPGMDKRVALEAKKLAALPLEIVDRPPTTITALRSELRRAARRTKISCVVVDYIQLLSGENRHSDSNRTQEVSEVTRGLKLLAMDLDVPVIALSQLNRQVEQRPNKRPVLSDLRDSGSVEQDADTVWFLYRESQYSEMAPTDTAELIVAKQRSGPQGTVHLSFNPECAKFSNRPSGFAPPPPSAPSGGSWSRRDSSPF